MCTGGKINSVALILVTAFVVVSIPVHASKVRQECQLVANGDAELPAFVQDYVERFNPTAIRVCKQIDFDTQSYYAVSAVSNANYVCQYAEAIIALDGPSGFEAIRYMAQKNGECPSQGDDKYTPVHALSDIEFSELSGFLQQAATSSDALSLAFNDRNDFVGYLEFEQDVMRVRAIEAFQIIRVTELLGMYSRYSVYVKCQGDNSKLYLLEIRKLFGGFVIANLSISII